MIYCVSALFANMHTNCSMCFVTQDPQREINKISMSCAWNVYVDMILNGIDIYTNDLFGNRFLLFLEPKGFKINDLRSFPSLLN